MSSVPNSRWSVKSPRPVLAEAYRLPRNAADDPYGWLYDVQADLGAALPSEAKSVCLALWARACTGRHKLPPGALEQETGLAPAAVSEALRLLADRQLISMTWLQSGVWHFYLLPVDTASARQRRED